MERQPKPETPGINELYDLTCRLKRLLEDGEGEGMATWHIMVRDLIRDIAEYGT